LSQHESSFRREATVGSIIFVAAFVLFFFSPVRRLGDNAYSLVLSQCILTHSSFALDSYKGMLPEHLELIPNSTKLKGNNFELVNGHIYYWYPPGCSILSLPYVALMNVFGQSPIDADGRYDTKTELALSAGLAAFLMACLGVVFFLTARQFFSTGSSAVLASCALLGTQIWSTASRVVEQDTWGALLLGLSILLLVSNETGRRRLNPVLLATLLSWTYFCRPTNSISIAAISIYLFIYHCALFLRYAVTGAFWLGLFVAYSWYNFHHLLPSNFLANRLEFDFFWTALAGDLISPSRGLLIYLPILIVPFAWVMLHWKEVEPKRLAILALAVVLIFLVAMAGYNFWWAGHCYGPRFFTGIVPWFFLISILGIKAATQDRSSRNNERGNLSWKLQIVALVGLAFLSIAINARGALSEETKLWNPRPEDVDAHPERLWDWSYPQFMAGLIHPPYPHGAFQVIQEGRRMSFSSHDIDPFLWYGWSGAEPEFRWTDGQEAALVFGLEQIRDLKCKLEAIAFVVEGKVPFQHVSIELNGQQISDPVFDGHGKIEVSFVLPGALLKRRNILTFRIPNAASPASVGVGDDPRLLGLSVTSIEFDSNAAVMSPPAASN